MLFGCFIFTDAPVCPGMSGADCQVNGEFVGMVHGGGIIFNKRNRCVSFAISSFENSLNEFKSNWNKLELARNEKVLRKDN